MTGPKAVREWIGLSLSEMADELNRVLAGHPKAGQFNKQKVDRWEKNGRMPLKVRRVYGLLLANDLTALLDRTVGVRIVANSPWHITAWAPCANGHWYRLRRADQKRCPKCSGRR